MPSPTDFNLSLTMMTSMSQKSFIEYFLDRHSQFKRRELTQSQSILQNQVEKVSDHLFEKGVMVMPGEIGYNLFYYSVKLTSFTDSTSCSWCNTKRFHRFKINRCNFRCNSKSNWC